ncbi:UbiA prenyltransferase family-domain-containing protein [Aspergillus granulosus]|uniref:UbiA prenyltransferase family-domain-containing protein n=1 Tax=Aspergillus granulosus TaxID=176169 RepID=A0ABR4H0F1_9EURO
MAFKSSTFPSLPSSAAAYVELTRLHRPLGTLVLFLPIVNGILHSVAVTPYQLPTNQVLDCAIKWLLISAVWLAFGCVTDDVIDQDLDRKVLRCRNRPVARGAISTTQGFIFAATLAIAFAVISLWSFPSPKFAWCLSIGIPGTLIYPFLKRFTNYAQLFLALLYTSASFHASRTVGFDVLHSGSLPLLRSNLSIMGALALNNIILETIYMHADLEDDIKHGIGSLAVRIQGSPKQVLFTLALVYQILLIISGVSAGLDTYYFIGAVCASVSQLYCIAFVNLAGPKSCQQYFRVGNAIVGTFLALGLYADHAA